MTVYPSKETATSGWLRLGFEVPANTLYTYWTHATTLLLLLARFVLSMVLAEAIVGVDDSSMPALDKSRKAGSTRGTCGAHRQTPGGVCLRGELER